MQLYDNLEIAQLALRLRESVYLRWSASNAHFLYRVSLCVKSCVIFAKIEKRYNPVPWSEDRF